MGNKSPDAGAFRLVSLQHVNAPLYRTAFQSYRIEGTLMSPPPFQLNPANRVSYAAWDASRVCRAGPRVPARSRRSFCGGRRRVSRSHRWPRPLFWSSPPGRRSSTIRRRAFCSVSAQSALRGRARIGQLASAEFAEPIHPAPHMPHQPSQCILPEAIGVLLVVRFIAALENQILDFLWGVASEKGTPFSVEPPRR